MKGKEACAGMPVGAGSTGGFLAKCKRIKGMPYLLLALAAGLILLLLPSGKSDPQTAESAPDAETYRLALEREIESLLRELDGVADCTVVLTLSSGYEYTYATDQKVREQSDGKETEKTVVLATQDGDEKPLPLREKQPVVCGAAVVCPGADEVLRNRIAGLLRALFSLEDPAISIQS